MVQLTKNEDISRLGTILSVWAHPDDETFSCAGIMAAAIKNNQRVVCLTATRGEKGVQDENRWPADRLAAIRSEELNDAMKILGVTEHHFLDYADGACGSVPSEEGGDRIFKYVREVRPDTIITFGPDGMTGHPDHRAVSAWASMAAAKAGYQPAVYHAVELRTNFDKYLKEADKKFNIYFNIDEPPLCQPEECDICFCLPDDICAKKCEALRAMPSQTERMLEAFGEETALEIFSCEAFIKAR